MSRYELAQLNIAVLKAPLDSLRASGPAPQAFAFRTAFPPPDAPAPRSPFSFGDECPAN